MELFFDDMKNLLSKNNISNKTCCLMGDFNIDLAQENDSSLTFRNMLLSNSFYNTIDKPTRITSRSISLIDNIFSNNHRDTLHAGILYSDISDHLPIFLILSNIISNKASRPPKIHSSKKVTQHDFDRLYFCYPGFVFIKLDIPRKLVYLPFD